MKLAHESHCRSQYLSQMCVHSGPATFMEIDHEIISKVILSLPLIQEGSCKFLKKDLST